MVHMTFLRKLMTGEYDQLIEKACTELQSNPKTITAKQLSDWYGELKHASSILMPEKENTREIDAKNVTTLVFYIVGSFANIINTCYENDKLKVKPKEVEDKLGDLIESLRILVAIDKKSIRDRSDSDSAFAKLSRSLVIDDDEEQKTSDAITPAPIATISPIPESGLQTAIERGELLTLLGQLYKVFNEHHPSVTVKIKSKSGANASVKVFSEYFTDQLIRLINREGIDIPDRLSKIPKKPREKQQAAVFPRAVPKPAADLIHSKKEVRKEHIKKGKEEDKEKKSDAKTSMQQDTARLLKIPQLPDQQAKKVVPPKSQPAVLAADQKIPAENILLPSGMIDAELRSVNVIVFNKSPLISVIKGEMEQSAFAKQLKKTASKAAEKRIQVAKISGKKTPSTVQKTDYDMAELGMVLAHPDGWVPTSLIAAIKGCRAEPSGDLDLFKLGRDEQQQLTRTVLQYLHCLAVYSGARISYSPKQYGKLVYPDLEDQDFAKSTMAQMNAWWRSKLGFTDKDFALLYGSLQDYAHSQDATQRGMLIANVLGGYRTDLLQLAEGFCKYVPAKSASSNIILPPLPPSPPLDPLLVPPEPVEMMPLVQPKMVDTGSQTDEDEKQPIASKAPLPLVMKSVEIQTDAQQASPAEAPIPKHTSAGTVSTASQTDKVVEQPLLRVVIENVNADAYDDIIAEPTSLKISAPPAPSPRIEKKDETIQTDALPASQSNAAAQTDAPPADHADAAVLVAAPPTLPAGAPSQSQQQPEVVYNTFNFTPITVNNNFIFLPQASPASPTVLPTSSAAIPFPGVSISGQPVQRPVMAHATSTAASQTETTKTTDEGIQTEKPITETSKLVSTPPPAPALSQATPIVPPKKTADDSSQTGKDEKLSATRAAGATSPTVPITPITTTTPIAVATETQPKPIAPAASSSLEQSTFLQPYLSNESLCNAFALFIAVGISPANVPLKPKDNNLLQDLFKFIFNKETSTVSARSSSHASGFTKFWEILKAQDIICFGDIRQDEIKIFANLSIEILQEKLSLGSDESLLYKAVLEKNSVLPKEWQMFFKVVFGVGDKPSYAQQLLREQFTLEHLKDFYKKEHGEGDFVCGDCRHKGFQEKQTFQDRVEEHIAAAIGYEEAIEDDMMKFAIARVTREWEKLQRAVDPASEFDLTDFNNLVDNIMWQRNQEALRYTSDGNGVEAKKSIEARIGELFEKLKNKDLPEIIDCVKKLKPKAAGREKQAERSKDQENEQKAALAAAVIGLKKEQEDALTVAVINLKSALISLQRCMWRIGYSLRDDSVRDLSELQAEKTDLISKCKEESEQHAPPRILASTSVDIRARLEERKNIKATGRVAAVNLPGVARGVYATYDRASGVFTIPASMMAPSKDQDSYATFNKWCLDNFILPMGGGRWGIKIISMPPKTVEAIISLAKFLTRCGFLVSFASLPDSQKEILQQAVDEGKKGITPLKPFVPASKDRTYERAARAMSLTTPSPVRPQATA